MIYDCFTFFNELDLLEIRLCLLYDHVDKFVIVEADKTFTNKPKPFFYDENSARYKKYADKIIHIKVTDQPESSNPWTLDIAQRECIKRGLVNCKDDDIIQVSDLDELIDPSILKKNITEPLRIQINFYYYFVNCKTSETGMEAFIAPYKFIKNETIDFLRYSKNSIQKYIPIAESGNSMHVSYLFGFNTSRYIIKLQSFAHQEYNKLPYISPSHIAFCIKYHIDFLLRDHINMTITSSKHFDEISLKLKDNPIIKECIYKKNVFNLIPNKSDYNTFLYIYLHKKEIVPNGSYPISLKLKVFMEYLYFIFRHY